MEYVSALSVHFAALALLFAGATGLLAAAFGELSFETDRTFVSIGAGGGSRKRNALLAALSLLAGGGLLVLAVREFRPPSYALFIAGSLLLFALAGLALKVTHRSVEAAESAAAKAALFLVNGIVLGLLLAAAVFVGRYLWRAFAAV